MRRRQPHKQPFSKRERNIPFHALPTSLCNREFTLAKHSGEVISQGKLGEPLPMQEGVAYVCAAGNEICVLAPRAGSAQQKGRDFIVGLPNGLVFTAKDVFRPR